MISTALSLACADCAAAALPVRWLGSEMRAALTCAGKTSEASRSSCRLRSLPEAAGVPRPQIRGRAHTRVSGWRATMGRVKTLPLWILLLDSIQSSCARPDFDRSLNLIVKMSHKTQCPNNSALLSPSYARASSLATQSRAAGLAHALSALKECSGTHLSTCRISEWKNVALVQGSWRINVS